MISLSSGEDNFWSISTKVTPFFLVLVSCKFILVDRYVQQKKQAQKMPIRAEFLDTVFTWAKFIFFTDVDSALWDLIEDSFRLFVHGAQIDRVRTPAVGVGQIKWLKILACVTSCHICHVRNIFLYKHIWTIAHGSRCICDAFVVMRCAFDIRLICEICSMCCLHL